MSFCFTDVFADKRHIAPKLNLVNVAGLNKLLRLEVFMSEDRQLRAVHLILDFKPLSDNFQDVGHAIKAGDPQLAWINVSVLGFLAREDLSLVELPLHRSSREVATLREKTASSRLSLKTEIDQFHPEDKGEAQGEPMEIADSEGALNRSSTVCSPRLIVAWVDSNSEEEQEMALNSRKGLKELLARKNKGSSSKDAPKSQPLLALPPPPHLTLNLLPMPNLKKKKKGE